MSSDKSQYVSQLELLHLIFPRLPLSARVLMANANIMVFLRFVNTCHFNLVLVV